MIYLSQLLLNEGAVEKSAEDFIKQITKGTQWEGRIFIAGGYVRDELLGKDPKDLDIMVDYPEGGIRFAEWITQKIGKYKENSNPVVYRHFGTAKFNLQGVTHNGHDLSNINIESVMPRQESYTPGSRKPSVQFSNLKGDAERRDLTINAMYKNISTGEFVDPTGMGMKDLKSKVFRTPLDPDKTFIDDPLRMLRVVRFFAKYGWKFSPGLIKAIKRNSSKLSTISSERVQDELNKMLITTRPAEAMKLLKITGLMEYIVPEFLDAYKMTQNIHHKANVWQHTLDVLSKTKPELLNRLTALFHDIGKVATKSITPTGVHFYGHEDVGSEMVEKILSRLKYPNQIISSVALGVKNHMRLKSGGDTSVNLSDKALRKFKMELGDNLETILDVIHADNISHSDESSMPNQIDNVRKRLTKLDVSTKKKPDLPINGNDLISMGLKPGPIFSKILSAITEAWFDNPKLSREEALTIAKSMIGIL